MHVTVANLVLSDQ